MKTRVVAAALLLLAGTGTSDPLLACGEKFLMGSRGTRFQRPRPLANPRRFSFTQILRLTCPRRLPTSPLRPHCARLATGRPWSPAPRHSSSALGQGGWDLVLADVADSQAVSSRTQNAKAPIVLPVMYNPTGAELAAAKKQHQRILKAPTKNQSFLDAIDDALALRSATQAKAGD